MTVERSYAQIRLRRSGQTRQRIAYEHNHVAEHVIPTNQQKGGSFYGPESSSRTE
jgi:hypothetical protein